MRKNLLLVIVVAFSIAGCMTAAEHSQSLHSSSERDFTVGLVQTRISKGMAQTDVAEALGSPNIVSKDSLGDESWIYDKIASEASYSRDSGGTGGLGGIGGAAGDVLLLGGLTGNYSRNAGAVASTQKTLTVIIKFDTKKRVKDFSYHSTKF